MRLIDAEHLRAWILARWEENDPTSAYPLKAGDILDQIEREMKYSTVEAIPVEWIKSWTERSENTYYRDQVISMMKDWRKEHETD